MNVIAALQKALAPVRAADAPSIMMSAIAKESGRKFGSKEERAQLAEAQKAYDEASRMIAAHDADRAREAWFAHERELQAAVKRGDLKTVDGYGREEIESEYRSKCEAAKRQRVAIMLEIRPVIAKLVEEFCLTAEGFAADQARLESEAYARFALSYPGPSPLIQQFRKAADYARTRVPRGDGGFPVPPREAVPFVDF